MVKRLYIFEKIHSFFIYSLSDRNKWNPNRSKTMILTRDTHPKMSGTWSPTGSASSKSDNSNPTHQQHQNQRTPVHNNYNGPKPQGSYGAPRKPYNGGYQNSSNGYQNNYYNSRGGYNGGRGGYRNNASRYPTPETMYPPHYVVDSNGHPSNAVQSIMNNKFFQPRPSPACATYQSQPPHYNSNPFHYPTPYYTQAQTVQQ